MREISQTLLFSIRQQDGTLKDNALSVEEQAKAIRQNLQEQRSREMTAILQSMHDAARNAVKR